MGAVMPEVLAAADELEAAGIASDVVCLTSADLVFRALQARQGLADGDDGVLDELLPAGSRRADRHGPRRPPHTLASSPRSAARRSPASASTTSASPATSHDLYRHFGIDADTIVGAALDLMEAHV